MELTFDHFFVRKVLLLKYSICFVVMPGGAGTIDELFEVVTLIQTGKVKNFPVILYGKDYWADTLKQLDHMYEAGTIGREELRFVHVVDSVGKPPKITGTIGGMWKDRSGKKDTRMVVPGR